MKKFYINIQITIIGVLILSMLLAFNRMEEQVGIVTKVSNSVSIKGDNGDWKAAKRADKILSGDKIKTDTKSTAVIKFLDGSILRVKGNTELVLYSDRAGTKIDKKVQVDVGNLGFNVKKQKEENFSFSSPSSVATIRGTDGGYGSGDQVDYLFIQKGLASFLNSLTGETIDVQSNFIAELNKRSGQLAARQLVDADKGLIDNLNADDESKSSSLILEFQMPDGQTKKIKIDYEE